MTKAFVLFIVDEVDDDAIKSDRIMPGSLVHEICALFVFLV